MKSILKNLTVVAIMDRLLNIRAELSYFIVDMFVWIQCLLIETIQSLISQVHSRVVFYSHECVTKKGQH